MRASPGDRLVVRSGLPGGRAEHAKILEARGPDGGPPFIVQWSDGRIEYVVPGPDASLEHYPELPRRRCVPGARAAPPG